MQIHVYCWRLTAIQTPYCTVRNYFPCQYSPYYKCFKYRPQIIMMYIFYVTCTVIFIWWIASENKYRFQLHVNYNISIQTKTIVYKYIFVQATPTPNTKCHQNPYTNFRYKTCRQVHRSHYTIPSCTSGKRHIKRQ